jgi:GT2 family glycosyltransferase
MTAPVALFVYNRPGHTRRTINELKANQLADQTDLYIFSDGPKGETDHSQVAEVRNYLHSVTGFRSVRIKNAAGNRGLAASIVEGVTEIVSKCGRVIVLEDDILTSPYFLTYMNDALERYADEERVMHISGYMYPVDPEGLDETFFCHIPSPWGWGTWQRAWRFFKKDVEEIRRTFTKTEINQLNLGGVHNFWEQVQHNWQGKADTWAIFWHIAIFREKGLCLTPSRSLTQNVGHDGTGVHCLESKESEAYMTVLRLGPVTNFSDVIEENTLALSRIKGFLPSVQIGRLKRLSLVLQKKWRALFC